MKIYYHRHRPHFQPPGAPLFITFRLFGSLPRHIIQQLNDEYIKNKKKLIEALNRGKRAAGLNKYYNQQKRIIEKFDDYLHRSNTGPHFLKNENVARLVCNTIKFWDQKKYDLLSYSVMSNHVHQVIIPLNKDQNQYYSMASIMHSIKSYSGNEANRILNRVGKPFWTAENFDHFSRSPEETERIVSYVLQNPVKPGLVKSPELWPWSYYKYW